MSNSKSSIMPAALLLLIALALGAAGGYLITVGNIDWQAVLRASGALAVVTLLLFVLGRAERFPKSVPFVALAILWTLATFGVWTLLQ